MRRARPGAKAHRLRVAVFLPRPSPFYLALLFGLKRGLERNDVEVFAAASLYDEASLLELCRQFKPQLVLEMNRTRAQVPHLPAGIVHAAWIVDALEHSVDYFCCSDITYFFGGNWRHAFQSQGGLVDWLPPGACEDSYPYRPKPPLSDFSFVGHIPKPWSQQELGREICRSQEGLVIEFSQFHDELLEHWRDIEIERHGNMTYLNSAYRLLAERYGQRIAIQDQSLRYDLGCRMIRMRNRHRLLALVAGGDVSLRIYGSANWRAWPAYRHYYRRFASSSASLCRIYQTTKLNLHEGVAPHFRVMDAMAAGGVMCLLRSYDDRAVDGMEELFEPFVHYIPFDESDFTALTEKYLYDTQARSAMAAAAAHEILARHTWTHRARKILDDYQRVVG
ncbi:MAG: hypothetical protein BWK76_05540 [Desulfobulbaceae bacterium A2]|nr:MAG: hypothetical protein BWK76_05540 [Desulfobulbaceae bacterium A2]